MDATTQQALVTAFGGLVVIVSTLVSYFFTKPKSDKVKIEGPEVDAAAGIFLRIAVALERIAAADELSNQLTMNHFGNEVAAELKALREAKVVPRPRARSNSDKKKPRPEEGV